MWNASNGEELHSFKHKHIVKTVSFDENSNHLITGSNEKLIRVYDLSQPNAEPEIFSGHGGPLKRALFCRNDKYIISGAEDKTLRLWDRSIGQEVQRIEFNAHPNSIELSADYNILTVTHGTSVSFWETETLKKLKEITLPTSVSTASLHPDKHIFVCAGEDFKMYKYDYITGNEIGMIAVITFMRGREREKCLIGFPFFRRLESFKGHFGPVHAVSFSPDGELYASGSEDGTLRLWQTTVGKTYGLWKCTEPGEATNSISAQREVPAN